MAKTEEMEALDMARELIQEAKGADGPNGGFVTDHLDAAEGWLGKVEASLTRRPTVPEGLVDLERQARNLLAAEMTSPKQRGHIEGEGSTAYATVTGPQAVRAVMAALSRNELAGALKRAAIDLHEAAGRFACIDKLDPKGCSELTREAARRADEALATLFPASHDSRLADEDGRRLLGDMLKAGAKPDTAAQRTWPNWKVRDALLYALRSTPAPDALREALQPFAEAASWGYGKPDSESMGLGLTVGDFRRAADALRTEGKPS